MAYKKVCGAWSSIVIDALVAAAGLSLGVPRLSLDVSRLSLGGPRLHKKATESKPVSCVLPESLLQFQSAGSCLGFPWRWTVS